MAQLLPINRAIHAFAYSIQFNGREIGNLQSFTPSSNTALNRIRAVSQGKSPGATIEIIRGNTDHQVVVTAIELYSLPVLEEMGYTNFSSIEDLRDPINIIETITNPAKTVVVELTYHDCQLQNYSKSGITSTGNVITDSATFWVAYITSNRK